MNKILVGVSGEVFASLIKGAAMVYISSRPFSFFPALNVNVMADATVAILRE